MEEKKANYTGEELEELKQVLFEHKKPFLLNLFLANIYIKKYQDNKKCGFHSIANIFEIIKNNNELRKELVENLNNNFTNELIQETVKLVDVAYDISIHNIIFNFLDVLAHLETIESVKYKIQTIHVIKKYIKEIKYNEFLMNVLNLKPQSLSIYAFDLKVAKKEKLFYTQEENKTLATIETIENICASRLNECMLRLGKFRKFHKILYCGY